MLLLFTVTLLLAAVLTGLIRRYALTYKVLDIPNQRSSHSVPTPRGGGLAIVLAFFAAVLWLLFTGQLTGSFLALLSATLLVAVIGFCDDHGEVAARWRFLTHLLAAIIALELMSNLPVLLIPAPFDALFGRLSINPGWLGYPLGALFLVWVLNLFNFMDGTDGIAASEALFVSSALAGYLFFIDQSLCAVALSLAAACGGFLLWNWPKAKIFMGDVGSGFIGLLLGLLILLAAQQVAVLLYCGLILFGAFIVDASYTLAVRMFSGQKWYAAHCSHTYQRAAKRYGHLPVLLATWAINCGWLLPISLWIFKHPSHALAGIALAYLPLIYLAYRFKAGQSEWVIS
ncbi:MraY family glycosyltransferase [Methylomonas fluvii]|uniref:Glycosyltransferase family 4 protein n=1 Tax=Methylomonas fluvii TaxID=1854564 RepID=A0ABR9D9R2_9GAMM|nr:glycosyltransferase family 4 protein [Methylomonas fluvii]MBD9359851.1 glycosyltransferase family 4 protein [Methylomonas fluvii]